MCAWSNVCDFVTSGPVQQEVANVLLEGERFQPQRLPTTKDPLSPSSPRLTLDIPATRALAHICSSRRHFHCSLASGFVADAVCAYPAGDFKRCVAVSRQELDYGAAIRRDEGLGEFRL